MVARKSYSGYHFLNDICYFIIYNYNNNLIMPIRQGKAKLWFNTKQEQDEYDDELISNIELTSSNEADDNYCLMFVRKKKQSFLTLRPQVQKQIEARTSIFAPRHYIQKYLAGKRDHTIDRYWNLQKGVVGWGVGYLLLRELPIRNFYARSSIMFFALAMYLERKTNLNPFNPRLNILKDQFTDKDIRNYAAYSDMTNPIIPNADNKIPEAKIWQLNQPAYMRQCHQAKMGQIPQILIKPTGKVVAWDGTFNMPLEGLAHPLHKDAKHIDFAWWEY